MSALSKQSNSPIEAEGNIRSNFDELDTFASIPMQGLQPPFLRLHFSGDLDPI
jgi:hypothetical protein